MGMGLGGKWAGVSGNQTNRDALAQAQCSVEYANSADARMAVPSAPPSASADRLADADGFVRSHGVPEPAPCIAAAASTQVPVRACAEQALVRPCVRLRVSGRESVCLCLCLCIDL